MKAFWDNFLKIAIGVILLYFVLYGGINWKQFVDGGSKIVEKAKK